ncbi:zf-TFIIB domain-containing protein [Vulgatibacter sp.]|uniref:TFIIB-type zinc ribbon-containing protein n=1 Tax=Vulgatibacter sp. TaxID=1971226 RepID=UPI003569D3B0
MANTPSNKPSSAEEEYFARENAEKLRRISLDRARAMQADEREKLKALHWMHCPKCGMEMQEISFRGVDIDRCFSCGVTVFDEGELQKLGVDENEPGAVMRSILNIFR